MIRATPGHDNPPTRVYGARNIYLGHWVATHCDGETEVLWYPSQAGIEEVLRLRMRAMGLPAEQWPDWFEVCPRRWQEATRISTSVRKEKTL